MADISAPDTPRHGGIWQKGLAVTAVFAIAAHLLLKQYSGGVLGKPLLSSILPYDVPLLIVIIAGGMTLLAQISARILKGNLGVDALAAISVVTGACLHEYLAAAIIVLMMAGGQALESYAMRRASSALLALSSRMPPSAHRKGKDGHVEDIGINEIAIGDCIIVYPHEACPVDGQVVEGHGSMDESYLTGEPYRISKAPGAGVLSGAVNGEAVLAIQATKLPSDSRYAEIMKVMQDAEQRRPALRRLGDQIGAIFTPVALTVAGSVWYITGDPLRFLSVLTIATPCPLLIAIPITVISAISMAARRGIIIKDPTVLERLPTCRTAIFDKTGTLTYGRPELTEILPVEGVTPENALRHAASLERYSKHPLASALLRAAEQKNLFLGEAINVSEKPGQGLQGNVEGTVIQITHRNHLMQVLPQYGALLPVVGTGLECILLLNGSYAATFRFRDAPRNESRSFIGHLMPSHQFSRVMLLSGDRQSETEYLASLLGIDEVYASQTPEQKFRLVREETTKAPTFFMGDGINDAPALAAATVGVAFGQHSSVTAGAAGAVVMDNTLIKVDELMHISLSMRRIALQSAVGGIMLSLAGMGFAAAGRISPVAGALLQECIDILAILNALRLTWKSNALFASDISVAA